MEKERKSKESVDGLLETFLKRSAKKHRINGTMKERNTISGLRKIPPMF